MLLTWTGIRKHDKIAIKRKWYKKKFLSSLDTNTKIKKKKQNTKKFKKIENKKYLKIALSRDNSREVSAEKRQI